MSCQQESPSTPGEIIILVSKEESGLYIIALIHKIRMVLPFSEEKNETQ